MSFLDAQKNLSGARSLLLLPTNEQLAVPEVALGIAESAEKLWDQIRADIATYYSPAAGSNVVKADLEAFRETCLDCVVRMLYMLLRVDSQPEAAFQVNKAAAVLVGVLVSIMNNDALHSDVRALAKKMLLRYAGWPETPGKAQNERMAVTSSRWEAYCQMRNTYMRGDTEGWPWNPRQTVKVTVEELYEQASE